MKKFFALMMTALMVCGFSSCKDKDGDGTGRVPKAGFEYSRDASFTVEFENTSTNATEYEWDFGDGTTSSEVSPTHTYTSKGTKHVVLYAYNGRDNYNTASAQINMTSYIKMVNASDNTYKIYIDGIDKGNLEGGNDNQWEVNPGSHTVNVVQQDGYTFYPTEETYTLSCTAGYVITKEFPVSPLGTPAQ